MIPQKIQPYFITTLQKKDGENTLVEGKLMCCNSHHFEVHAVGKIKQSIFSKMYLLPEDNKMILETRCKKCGKVFSVFDNNSDGYEKCEINQSVHNTVKPISCKKCQINDYSVAIKYEYPDIQELDNIGIVEPDNAFTWIWITLECNKCGNRYRNFIDYETA